MHTAGVSIGHEDLFKFDFVDSPTPLPTSEPTSPTESPTVFNDDSCEFDFYYVNLGEFFNGEDSEVGIGW